MTVLAEDSGGSAAGRACRNGPSSLRLGEAWACRLDLVWLLALPSERIFGISAGRGRSDAPSVPGKQDFRLITNYYYIAAKWRCKVDWVDWVDKVDKVDWVDARLAMSAKLLRCCGKLVEGMHCRP